MYRIGIDLGGTNIAVGVVDDHHRIVAEASLPAGAHRPAEQVVADMCRAVELALDKAGLTVRDCASIGVGAPGTCDPERGVVVRAYNLNWFDVPVCAMLTAHFGLPARLSNDANCAALAETVAGAAVGCRSMVLITLGTMAASWTVYGHECQSTVLYGTKGLMMIYSEPSAPIIVSDLEGNRTSFAFDTTSEKSGVIDEFVDALVHDRDPEVSGKEALTTMRTIFGSIRSSDIARPVAVNTDFVTHI